LSEHLCLTSPSFSDGPEGDGKVCRVGRVRVGEEVKQRSEAKEGSGTTGHDTIGEQVLNRIAIDFKISVQRSNHVERLIAVATDVRENESDMIDAGLRARHVPKRRIIIIWQ
jgi:hypothetical protein